jgi:allantoinase
VSGAPEHVRYLPIVDRPPLEWPGGARLALWLSPNIEHYELVPAPNPYRSAWPRMGAPDVLDWSYRDYGNRVGFWRMLDVLDRYPIRPTATANLAALELYPEIRDAVVERGWEVICHGLHNTEFLFGMREDEEDAFLAENVERATRALGVRPSGFLGPFASMTPRTMDLVARHGFRYSADWYVDDQPIPLKVATGRLVSVPYSWEVNDAITMELGLGRYDVDEFARICIDQFDTLYRESAERGLVMHLALHPFLIGRPHRIRHLASILDHVLGRDGVWVATGGEIADHYLEHHHDRIVELLRERGVWDDVPDPSRA